MAMNAASAHEQVKQIGEQFVRCYYTNAATNPENLKSLYTPESVLTYEGNSFYGLNDIQSKLSTIPKYAPDVKFMDVQIVMPEDITIVVGGSLKVYYILGACGTGVLALVLSLEHSVNAMTKLVLHPPHQHWSHSGIFDTLDMASVRRGYFVYKQVCVACHSMKYKFYRQIADAFMTVEEAKAEAAETSVTDGPDEHGAMFQRPGKLADAFPSPYPNEQAARAANNGAYPPDLSFIVRAREGNEDYIFSILTGYEDAPAGVTIADKQYYNPYFPGGAISMAPALYDDIIEYEDGTPATLSQLAKDVVTFLRWSADPQFEERKRRFYKILLYFPFVFAGVWYMYRKKITLYKSQKLFFKPLPKDKFV